MSKLQRQEIEKVLQSLGAGRNYMGYNLLVDGVAMAYENPDSLLFVTKELYPQLAKRHNVSTYSVERNIRTMARLIYTRMPARLNELATYDITQPPSASQLIDIIVNYLIRTK